MVAAALAATYIAGVFEGGLGYTLEVLDLAQVTAFTKVGSAALLAKKFGIDA